MKMLIGGLALVFVGLFFFGWLVDNRPSAVHAPEAKLEPVDLALVGCENWTKENSKLAVGAIEKEYVITGRKVPANHYVVGLQYRAGDSPLLMKAECEYSSDGKFLALVKARTGLR